MSDNNVLLETLTEQITSLTEDIQGTLNLLGVLNKAFDTKLALLLELRKALDA